MNTNANKNGLQPKFPALQRAVYLSFDSPRRWAYFVKLKMKCGLASVCILGGLLLGSNCLAQTPLAPPPLAPPKQQSIIFSSPDGTASSGTPLPGAEMPQANALPDSSANVPVALFGSQLPPQRFPRPARLPMTPDRSKKNQNPNDFMSSPTAAEIMGVPTLEEIFGLPKSSSTNDQNQAGSNTNFISADGSIAGESTWGQMMANGESFNPNDPSPAYGAISNSDSAGISGSSFNNSTFGNSAFDDHRKNADDSAFGSSAFAQIVSSQPSGFGSPPSVSAPAISLPADPVSFVPKTPPVDSAFNAGFAPQSAFSFPKSSLSVSPQLPSVPAFQNPYGNYGNYSGFGQSAVHPWQPIAPWQQTVPPLGTMTPRKF